MVLERWDVVCHLCVIVRLDSGICCGTIPRGGVCLSPHAPGVASALGRYGES